MQLIFFSLKNGLFLTNKLLKLAKKRREIHFLHFEFRFINRKQ